MGPIRFLSPMTDSPFAQQDARPPGEAVPTGLLVRCAGPSPSSKPQRAIFSLGLGAGLLPQPIKIELVMDDPPAVAGLVDVAAQDATVWLRRFRRQSAPSDCDQARRLPRTCRGSGTGLRPCLFTVPQLTKDLGVSCAVGPINATVGARVNAQVAATSKPA